MGNTPHMSWISLRLLLAIAIVVVPRAIAGFDEEQFMKNGPHQQGTIKIDRSKLQTVVTICSPTLLQMAVYDDVDLASVQKYDQSSDGSPLQISVTVFPPTLPFPYASNYGEPSYATSDCSPASVATTLSTTPPASTDLKYALDQGASQNFTVTGLRMRAVMVDCTSQTAGPLDSTKYEYGQKGGVALIPAGALPVLVVGECDVTGNEFAIRIGSLIGSEKDAFAASAQGQTIASIRERRRREEGMKTAGFDEEQFMKNGPHQQGTIKIDRSKLQTVVTICSPT